MDGPSVSKLTVRNFGCIGYVADVQITPLHAFIGPNDSGKTTLLRALRLAVHRVSGATGLPPGGPYPFASDEAHETVIDIRAQDDTFYNLRTLAGGGVADSFGRGTPKSIAWDNPIPRDLERSGGISEFRGVGLMRLKPDALRTSSRPGDPFQRKPMGDDGEGLATALDEIMCSGTRAALALQVAVQKFFPAVESVALELDPSMQNITKKRLVVTLKNGKRVGANALSEGLLYFLGYQAVLLGERPSVLLVEEPENGLHPARIKEVIELLRGLTEDMPGVQVVMATHSPLVINELHGGEVSVVTRDKLKGTQVTNLTDTPHYQERVQTYRLGELWLAYTDAESERELLGTVP
jgi:ABC-type branched-subunit amino acid transport system ATPase component